MQTLVNLGIYIDFLLDDLGLDRLKFIFEEAASPVPVLLLLQTIEL